MRIGYVYIHSGIGGGIERASGDLAVTMAQLGHNVHFHCASSTVSPAGVTLHHVYAPDWPNSVRLAVFAVTARAQARGGKYDILHSHGNIIGADVITAHSCHRAGLRILATVPVVGPRSRRNYGLADAVRLFIEKETYGKKRYRAVIAVSTGIKNELMEHYGVPASDIAVIPNGVDVNRFRKELLTKMRAECRRRLVIPDETHVLLFVGNEFDRKGLANAIAAVRQINREDIVLLVIGGDDPAPYARLAKEMGVLRHVRFLGHREGIDDLYAAADIFVFPSLYEASSVAVLEAAAAGLPLVLTRFHGSEVLLEEGKTGFYVNGDPAAIARAVSVCVQDKDIARRMGEAARTKAAEFDLRRIGAQVFSVYERILAGKGRR